MRGYQPGREGLDPSSSQYSFFFPQGNPCEFVPGLGMSRFPRSPPTVPFRWGITPKGRSSSTTVRPVLARHAASVSGLATTMTAGLHMSASQARARAGSPMEAITFASWVESRTRGEGAPIPL